MKTESSNKIVVEWIKSELRKEWLAVSEQYPLLAMVALLRKPARWVKKEMKIDFDDIYLREIQLESTIDKGVAIAWMQKWKKCWRNFIREISTPGTDPSSVTTIAECMRRQ
jgi:hypothetical protein